MGGIVSHFLHSTGPTPVSLNGHSSNADDDDDDSHLDLYCAPIANEVDESLDSRRLTDVNKAIEEPLRTPKIKQSPPVPEVYAMEENISDYRVSSSAAINFKVDAYPRLKNKTCLVCGKSFRSHHYLQKHVIALHNDNLAVKNTPSVHCIHCGKKLTSANSHIKTKSGKFLNCKECWGKLSSSPNNVSKSKTPKVVVCNECGKRLGSKSLKRHLIRVHKTSTYWKENGKSMSEVCRKHLCDPARCGNCVENPLLHPKRMSHLNASGKIKALFDD